MFGSSFRPQLESLGDRVCLSAVGGDFMAAVDFKGEEAGLIGLLHPGEEQGAAVDYNLLLPAVRDEDPAAEKGAAVDYKGEEHGVIAIIDVESGESGWDVKSGEERALIGL